MKKYLIALVLGLVLILALATTVALADNGPHGGFTASTDACAGCHRVHTAQYGSNALLIMDPEALCLSCHDGTGASTNVEMGVYTNAAGAGNEGVNGASLFGGGFTDALMATAWSGQYAPNSAYDAVSSPVSSSHTIGSSGTIWGSGANNTANGSMVLECTSCHDPHGNGGWNTTTTPDVKVASYRLLRWQPSGSDGFTAPSVSVNWSGGAFPMNDTGTSGWLVPDKYATLGTEWYTIGSQIIAGTGPFAVGDYNNGNGNNTYQPYNGTTTQSYLPAAINVAFFCAQCHDRYFDNSSLRNATDVSAYCGAPYAGVVSGSVTLTVQADIDGIAPWNHPDDPTRCIPVTDSANNLLSWGDDGASGDTLYAYRHSSGDIRTRMDLTGTAGSLDTDGSIKGTSLSRSCVACHVAHGTSAKADVDFVAGNPLAVPPTVDNYGVVNAAAATLSGDSALLRMDGRTICLRCHAPNYTVATTAPSGMTVTAGVSGTGPGAGGDLVTITGTGFSTTSNPGISGIRFAYTNASGTAVNASYNPAASTPAFLLSDFTALSNGACFVTSTLITCRTGEGYGVATVSVVTTGSVLTPAGSFTFVAHAAPTITSLTPSASGTMAGGTAVAINGTNFSGNYGAPYAAATYKVTSVAFGARTYTLVTGATAVTAGTCKVASAILINCQTIATFAGAVDVKVTTTGTQFATSPYTFTNP